MTRARSPLRGKKKVFLTSARKKDYLRICLQDDVAFLKKTGFEDCEFEHLALSELNFSEIELTTQFLGRKFGLPFFIEPLTGGFPGAEKINRNLAAAAQELRIGMGLGSQRAMLENPELAYTYHVRETAPEILLFGNIGATQLKYFSVKEIEEAILNVGADGLAIHLNAVQELCQLEGDKDWTQSFTHIAEICSRLPVPVMVKETGCGIAAPVAHKMESAGATCLDVAGAGGTSMPRVEYRRGATWAKNFLEWGIPTAEALRQCRKAVKIPLIASGGIRTGVDCAKALALGADLAGLALPLLRPAMQSSGAVIRKLQELAKELRMAMHLVGAENISALKKVRLSPPFQAR